MKKFIFTLCALSAATLFAQQDIQPKFYVGTNTHYGQNKGFIEKGIESMQFGGINSIRDEFYWGVAERKKGELVLDERYGYIGTLKDAGFNPLIILDYGNHNYANGGGFPQDDESVKAFARFCGFAAKNLKGKASFFQIWNEWDGGCGMPAKFNGQQTYAGYAKLLKASYKAIKEQDKNAKVVINSICRGNKDFEEMLKAGTMNYCDILSLHTYNHSEGKLHRTPEAWYGRLANRVAPIIRKYNNGKDKDLFVTEMGFTTPTIWLGYSYNQSADYAARLYLLARTIPWLKGIWWYDFQDDGIDESNAENNFGTVRANFTPKPSYYAISGVADIAKYADFVCKIDTGNPNVYILKYKLGNEDILAMWNCNEDKIECVRFTTTEQNPKDLTLYLAGSQKINMPFGIRQGSKLIPNKIDFSLGQRPLIVRGDLSKLTYEKTTTYPFVESERERPVALHMPAMAAFAKEDPNASPDYKLIAKKGEKAPDKSDLSASFKACYNKDMLALQITIKDQKVEISKDINNGDNAMLFFFVDKESKTFGKSTSVKIAPNGKYRFRDRQFNQDVSGFSVSCKKIDGGCVYTVQLKPETLGLLAFEKGLGIGFAMNVNDFDNGNKKSSVHFGQNYSESYHAKTKFNLLYLD